MNPRFRALRLFVAGGLSLVGASCLSSCRARDEGSAERVTRAALAVEPGAALDGSNTPRVVLPFEQAAVCQVEHAGMFLDLGTDTSHARRSFMLGPFPDLASDTWSDQSYTRFMTREAHYDFWLSEPLPGFELRMRAKGGSAQSLAVRIDDQPLGSARVNPTAFTTLSFAAPKQPLGPGRHELELRWSGRARDDERAHGMIEWVHWAAPGGSAQHYRAPRLRSLRDDVVLGGEPRRAIVLEAPSSLACPVQVKPGARLVLGLGHPGEGDVVAQIVARRDGAAPRVLAERRVSGGAAAAWLDLSVDLTELAPHLTDIELRAGGTAGARLSVSEPRIVTDDREPAAATAKLAVLVVASGLHRELLPPFATTRRLRHLAELAGASARFAEYRAPSSVVNGVMASLLSGLPPIAHGVEAPKSRLPARVQLLSERLREISGESAMYTGVPHTRPAFGFDRGWSHYEAFSPVNDVPAAQPVLRARSWIEQSLARDPDLPRLVVVHLRGGHPPWDLSRDEVSELEPREYGGLLEARRGGIILGSIRSHSRLAQRRLPPADWVRLRALQLAALAKQDDALGGLIDQLERAGVWDETLFIFTGDVASGDPPEAPFGAARPLSEDRLLLPLWIKFPQGQFAGSTLAGLTTSTDVATTIARALGVRWPDGLGEDLHRMADGAGPAAGRSLVATLGAEYATRWGSWLLRGSSPKTPTLCELSVDPACAADVLGTSPLSARALWRATFEAYRAQRKLDGAARGVELADIDRDTAAALQVWGE